VAQAAMVAVDSAAGVDQILGQRADDAVAAGIQLADAVAMARAVSMTPLPRH
jgi:hypothetical protein